jgi:hypothetical protein
MKIEFDKAAKKLASTSSAPLAGKCSNLGQSVRDRCASSVAMRMIAEQAL